jgi:hypothetical protein
MRPISLIQMMRVVAAWFAVAASVLAAPPAENDEQSPQSTNAPATDKPKPKITIGKETTYITQPLRLDGYPDYVAALNQRMSEGVAPENNAAVLLQKAFGPREIPDGDRATYFKQLGIEVLPERGDYVVSDGEIIERWRRDHLDASSEEVDGLGSQFGEVAQRPWRADEFPLVAKWVARNETPLNVVVEATQRKRCYFPLVAGARGTEVLYASGMRHQNDGAREAATCLCVRSMMKVAQGDSEGAWRDVLSCHRLSRLIDQGPFLLDRLVAISIEFRACHAGAMLAHYGRPRASVVQQMSADLRRLPPLKTPADILDVGERFVFLDAVCDMARGQRVGFAATVSEAALPELLNFDSILRVGNEWFDKSVAAAQLEERRHRAVAAKAVEDEFHKFYDEKKSPESLALDISTKGIQKGTSIHIAAQLLSLTHPAVPSILQAETRCHMLQQLRDVSFALAACRADAGQYPQKLDELVPKYFAEVPDNLFADKPTPIQYRCEGEAYLLWSPGMLKIDRADKSRGDDPDEDHDLVLRPMPVKNNKAK